MGGTDGTSARLVIVLRSARPVERAIAEALSLCSPALSRATLARDALARGLARLGADGLLPRALVEAVPGIEALWTDGMGAMPPLPWALYGHLATSPDTPAPHVPWQGDGTHKVVLAVPRRSGRDTSVVAACKTAYSMDRDLRDLPRRALLRGLEVLADAGALPPAVGLALPHFARPGLPGTATASRTDPAWSLAHGPAPGRADGHAAAMPEGAAPRSPVPAATGTSLAPPHAPPPMPDAPAVRQPDARAGRGRAGQRRRPKVPATHDPASERPRRPMRLGNGPGKAGACWPRPAPSPPYVHPSWDEPWAGRIEERREAAPATTACIGEGPPPGRAEASADRPAMPGEPPAGDYLSSFLSELADEEPPKRRAGTPTARKAPRGPRASSGIPSAGGDYLSSFLSELADEERGASRPETDPAASLARQGGTAGTMPPVTREADDAKRTDGVAMPSSPAPGMPSTGAGHGCGSSPTGESSPMPAFLVGASPWDARESLHGGMEAHAARSPGMRDGIGAPPTPAAPTHADPGAGPTGNACGKGTAAACPTDGRAAVPRTGSRVAPVSPPMPWPEIPPMPWPEIPGM